MITISLNSSFLPQERDNDSPVTPSAEKINEPIGVIERLKDQFGDYSDPLTYDWTWRETD